MKCLTYLTDTYSHNGPFTMLIDYDRRALSKTSSRANKLPHNRQDDTRPHRWSTAAIADATTKSRAFAVELHAPAGTVICFDSGSVHHGKNVQYGSRASMTTYFLSPRESAWSAEAAAKRAMRS